jgi:hypothetical protein
MRDTNSSYTRVKRKAFGRGVTKQRLNIRNTGFACYGIVMPETRFLNPRGISRASQLHRRGFSAAPAAQWNRCNFEEASFSYHSRLQHRLLREQSRLCWPVGQCSDDVSLTPLQSHERVRMIMCSTAVMLARVSMLMYASQLASTRGG